MEPAETLFVLGEGSIFFRVNVLPKASANRIEGIAVREDGAALKVRVTAVPDKGKANKAIVRLLSKQTGVASGRFDVVSGMTSRKKRLKISGADEELLNRLIEWSKSLNQP